MYKSVCLTTPMRCGTQWLREILISLLSVKMRFPGYHESGIQEWPNYIDFVLNEEKKNPGEHIVSVHIPIEHLNIMKDFFNMIVLVRDPRDICVSMSFKSHTHEEKIMGSLKTFIKTGGPIPEFYPSYIKHKSCVSHILVKYEDLLSDTLATLKGVQNYLGYNKKNEAILKVIENKSFFKLSGGRQPGEEDQKSHYRKGIKGDWKNYFTNDMNEEFWMRHSYIMKEWGYKKNG